MDNDDYFALRNIASRTYEGFALPAYLSGVLTDPDARTASLLKRAVRRFLLRLYRWDLGFWNKVTCSAYHASSPQIFHEIKALARA